MEDACGQFFLRRSQEAKACKMARSQLGKSWEEYSMQSDQQVTRPQAWLACGGQRGSRELECLELSSTQRRPGMTLGRMWSQCVMSF